MASTLIGRGRVSRDVLTLLMSTPGQEMHTREVARRVKADVHAVHRALDQLLEQRLVQSRRLGNLRLWALAAENPLLPALREFVRRTTGLAKELREELAPLRGTQFAFLFGSYAAGRDKLGSDIDLFLVGSPDWRRLSKVLTSISSEIGREVNPVVWTLGELQTPSPTQARFLRRVLREPKIWLVGDDHEFDRSRAPVGAEVVAGSSRPSGRGGRRRRSKALGTRRAEPAARKPRTRRR